jgi:mono/diheme cytochrome c family protein
VSLVAATLAGCGALGAGRESEEARVARGEALYDTHCIDCHGGPTGGDLADVPPRHNAQGHTWHHGDCELVRWTLEGLPPRPGLPPDTPPMPAFAGDLDEADVEAILAHLRTWWTPEQRAHQERVTAQVC